MQTLAVPVIVRMMDAYAGIDDVIAAWVKAKLYASSPNKLTRALRYFHIPGDPSGRMLRAQRRSPENGRVVVVAGAIDTNDDTDDEMAETWEGPVGKLDAMFRTAVATIDEWKARVRKGPDPRLTAAMSAFPPIPTC